MAPYGRVLASIIQMVGFADQTAAIPGRWSQHRRWVGDPAAFYGPSWRSPGAERLD